MARVLHASYSGYFPYCILPYQQNDIFPIYSTTSLDNAMRLFWRIKKIKFGGTYLPPPFTETRDWEMIVESSSASEKNLVCNPGWQITSTTNLIDEEQLKSSFLFEDVTADNGAYVVRLSFGGWFKDTFGPEGWSFRNPSAGGILLNFEGIEMYGELPETATFNYQIQEYWSYDGIYSTFTGDPL